MNIHVHVGLHACEEKRTTYIKKTYTHRHTQTHGHTHKMARKNMIGESSVLL